MSSQSSSKESSDTDSEDSRVLDMMANDILNAKTDLEDTIDEIKESINILFSYFVGSKLRSNCLKSLRPKGRFGVEEKASDLFEKNLLQLQRKAALDLKFVQLYDKFMAKEFALELKNKYLKNHLSFMKEKFDKDFRRLNEEAERTVKCTKSKLEEYIGVNSEETKKSTEFLDRGVFMKLKEKALGDLHYIKKQSEKDIQRTKMRINENIGVFLTNPTGPKTQEELESEQFIKDQIINLKETVAEDLKASKEITEKIASRTKHAIEKLSTSTDGIPHAEYEGFNFTVEKLQDKAFQDFIEAKTEMENKVTNIKETFQNTILDVSSSVSTSGVDNSDTPSFVSPQQKTNLISPNVPIKKFRTDFQTIDEKMKEDANDLKVGITGLVNNVKQKLNEE